MPVSVGPGRSGRAWAVVSVWWRAAELDRLLAAGTDPNESRALAIRARRITSARSRRRLAAGLAEALTSARMCTPPFTPACREVVAARTVLETLERRLLSMEPITPKGAAILFELLTDGASPLYLYLRPGLLGSRLRAAAAALEPQSPWGSDRADSPAGMQAQDVL